MNRTILFIEWKSFGNLFIKEAFRNCGYDVECMPLDNHTTDTCLDTEYTEKLAKQLLAKPYFCVFSFDYFPIIAVACKACRVPYLSWTYDSPCIQLYSPTLEFDTNFAFVFDRGTCIDLEKKGYPTYYMPMAAPMDCYGDVLKKKEMGKKYAGDISFVGSLYNEPFGNLYRYMEKLGSYEKGFVEALVSAQKNVYGCNFMETVLKQNPEVVKKIQESCPVYATGNGLDTAEWTMANYVLARKVTSIERMEIMELLGEKFGVNLYTPNGTDIKGVRNMGKADYYLDAPHIFANSKINLNITLKSILTGIPLRAFDIMGCGGFLLTNYQEDFLEYFEPDEDFVFYYDYGDLVEKTAFYLEHDAERMRIAGNAHRKVAAEHTYLQRVEAMLNIVNG